MAAKNQLQILKVKCPYNDVIVAKNAKNHFGNQIIMQNRMQMNPGKKKDRVESSPYKTPKKIVKDLYK